MNNSNSISLKPINDLLKESFYIPAYQRGYRWTEKQVTDLLEDVLNFETEDKQRNPDAFYCLQPIVVKLMDTHAAWEVVDGQQRLTTLFLILQYFNTRIIEEERDPLYKIEYETRPGSADFLLNPNDEDSQEYIDYYFIYSAYETIKEWFKNRRNIISDFQGALLNRVKVIWYELPKEDDAVRAFTRLNMGKIPLTNSELVRALFLRSRNFPEITVNLEQLKIAQEWDLMEKALQNDDFWYFLTSEDDADRANRIELLFDLITEESREGKSRSEDELESFHHFNYLLSTEDEEVRCNPDELWRKVKSYYMTLEEWYNDPELFHLIGYLINEGVSILSLIGLSQTKGKSALNRALRDLIYQNVLGLDEDETCDGKNIEEQLTEYLSDLVYGCNNTNIKSALLLFNIASIIANSKSIVRFRFDYFKKQSWDIEHIRSVTEYRPDSNVEIRPWLEEVSRHLSFDESASQLHDKVKDMLQGRTYTTGDAFEELYNEVVAKFDEAGPMEGENGLGNLALLDSGTNRGYRNMVFPIKRKKLLKYDREGTFVPLCTRNAFLKAYNKEIENMFVWGGNDARNHLSAIIETFSQFFAYRKVIK